MKTPILTTPIRYPGGKSKAVKKLYEYLPNIEDYEHPANAEHDMNRRYTKIAVQRAKELAENPIVQTAVQGGAIKLSKDTQHLFEMLDIADDIIDKQLIMEGNYSPIIDSKDSYLGVYSYN